jgi:KDO2-lipid IV(A) lauroyltransferase
VPAFIHRVPDGDHQITLEPPLALCRTGQRDRDVVLNTARFTEVIERQVRTHPEQWFWVHRRWKTRPP